MQWYYMWPDALSSLLNQKDKKIHFRLDSVLTHKIWKEFFLQGSHLQFSGFHSLKLNIEIQQEFLQFFSIAFWFDLVLSKSEMTQHCQTAYKSLDVKSSSNLKSEPRVMYNSFFHSFFAIVFPSEVLLPIMNTVQLQFPLQQEKSFLFLHFSFTWLHMFIQRKISFQSFNLSLAGCVCQLNSLRKHQRNVHFSILKRQCDHVNIQ